MTTATKATTGRMTEAEIRIKYPNVVPGTLRFDRKANKSKVTIRCTARRCKKTLRVYTSDVFQVRFCDEHLANAMARRRASMAKAAAGLTK